MKDWTLHRLDIHAPLAAFVAAGIVDHRGDTLGWGLYSPVSDIAVRMLSFGEAPPPPDWLRQRLVAAVRARDCYRFDDDGTTGFREVNSEGDGLPGLVVDRYGDARSIDPRALRVRRW